MTNTNELVFNQLDDTKEIIVRQGEALKQLPPVKFKTTGIINAPKSYVEKREHIIEKDKCIVIANRNEGTIKFIEDVNNEISTEITGKLEVNPDLQKFNINTEKTMDLTALIKFLRMNRMHFDDQLAFNEFINKLANFKATVTRSMEQRNDNRGNIKTSIEQIAETDMPNSFVLSIPLFKGHIFPKMTFQVNIYLATRDAAVDFWFESFELHELLIAHRDSIFDGVLANLVQYVIIEQ